MMEVANGQLIGLVNGLQRRIFAWGAQAFGMSHMRSKHQRLLRTFEEMTELMQSEGVTTADLQKVINMVYNKTPGEPKKEAAQTMLTLFAYCESQGFSLIQQLLIEDEQCHQILNDNPTHFRERNQRKEELLK